MPITKIDRKIMGDVDVGSLPGPAYPTQYNGPIQPRHLNDGDKLNQMADDSHQDHKAVTGQVPNVDPEDEGYTTYQHKGAYYQPGEGDD